MQWWQTLLLILAPFIMLFCIVIIKQNSRAKKNGVIVLSQIKDLLQEIYPYEHYQKYTDKTTFSDFHTKMSKLHKSIGYFTEEAIRTHEDYKAFQTIKKKWNLLGYQRKLIDLFVEHQFQNEEVKAFFDHFQNISLDDEQRRAVLVDEKATLVAAAAGSGKTLTIAAKVAYLIKFHGIKPNDILLITFTSKACEELSERVSKAINQKVHATTFHEFGLSVLTQAYEKKPTITDQDYLDEVIDDYLRNDLIKKTQDLMNFTELFAYYMSPYIDEEDFQSRSTYTKEMRGADLETLKSKFYVQKEERQTLLGEKVKSLAELQIANYLYMHGIEYIYEHPYQVDTADIKHRQYHPDFYLPDFNIYIEHYGIDEDERAKWLKPSEEKKYLQGMIWKRNLHQNHGTICIETFSYQARKGELLSKLEDELKDHNITVKEPDYKMILEKMTDNNSHVITEFHKLIKTFILLIKESGQTTVDDKTLLSKLSSHRSTSIYRAQLFLKLITPIFAKYQIEIKNRNQIDFADMINLSINYIKEQANIGYQYIIVDEYQDISLSKSKLIDKIIEKTNAKLFCVGDDWQSIFRYAGSDIDQFVSFESYYPSSEILKIQKTYRNPQELVDMASSFVMKNKAQIKKEITATKHVPHPLFLHPQNDDLLLSILSKIIAQLLTSFDVREVLILGRYNFDLDDNELYNIKYEYPDIDFTFLSIHKAKGLEAEHVIILNSKNQILGFPSKIADDEVLSMVTSHQEKYMYAEERRLFYVALTRAKYTCHLIVPENHSVFVEEIISDFKDRVIFDQKVSEDKINCPKCDGYLVKRMNKKKDFFYGCSNYPYCEYTAPKNTEVSKRCPSCGDYMILKNGKHGLYLECNSYKFLKCPRISVK